MHHQSRLRHPDRAHCRARARHRGLPLGLLIGRYFVYVLLCTLIPAGLATSALIFFVNYGTLYPANYGVNNLERVSGELAAQPRFDASAIPSAYWYAHLSAAGEVLSTDMSETQLAHAVAAVREADESGTAAGLPAGPTSVSTVGPAGLALAGSYTYGAVNLGDGSWCVLACDLVPQFTTRELRDSLPDPQSLYLAVMTLSFVVPLIVFAIRASRVITRKMNPLLAVADRVSRRDLDFEVGTSDVRQINDVLTAMERMRSGLKDSLERQWEAEHRQRDQVAALAHDLKTPLTVVRANAELLAEEDAGLTGEDRACADDIARAARQLDDYVRLLIEASQATVVPAGPASASSAPAGLDLSVPVDVPSTSRSGSQGGAAAGVETQPASAALFVPVGADAGPMASDGGTLEAFSVGSNAGLAAADGVLPAFPLSGAAGPASVSASATGLGFASGPCFASGGVGPIPAADFARDIVREAHALVTASHATFLLATGADATLPGILRIDELAIRRAVMNVVANAIDYGWPGGTIRLEFTVSAAHLAITVDDDGPGFSSAALAHGTERFFRGDPARTQATTAAATRDLSEEGAAPAPSARVPGATGDVLGSLPTSDVPSSAARLHSGLGLAIADEAIRAAGGTLTLANRTAPDGAIAGARVTLTLPLTQP